MDSDDAEIDLLSLLGNYPSDLQVAVRDESSRGLVELPSALPSSSDDPEHAQRNDKEKLNVKLPKMIGKVGPGRHGDQKDKDMLTLHMRHCKAMISGANFRQNVAELLDGSSFRSEGNKLIGVRAERSCTGIVIKLKQQSCKGNRFRKIIPWCDFLSAAFGKLKRDSHISLSMGISRQTASLMTTTVSSVYLAQQSAMLGRLLALVQSKAPLFLIRHFKWDETTLWTSLNIDNDQKRVASAWQVMVCKQRLVLGFDDGSVAIMRVVMAPAVLLGAGAHHMFYTIQSHPMYKSLQGLVDSIADLTPHKVQIYESDGAYSNERLFAHLLQRNKSSVRPAHLLHVKCQNHQCQLVNVSLLASVGANILNRMYGFTVFVRNLGNWVRLKQALHTWIDENLIFLQEVSDTDRESYTSRDPRILELIDFLRSNRRVESEHCDSSPAFERAVSEFLQMFNGSLSRDLKNMGLTADDLAFGNCRRVLYWTAATLQLSIADVESMHSQNRVLQGSSFSSISAKYVNSEALRIRDEARKLQFGKSENRQDLRNKKLGSIGTGNLKVCYEAKSPTAKGASALEIFRKHHLKLQSHGGKVNPCSKESWDAVRRAFASLTPHEKSLYEQLAHDSRVDALAKRKVKKQILKTGTSKHVQKQSGAGDNDSSQAVVPHDQSRAGVHLQILPVHELCNLFQTAGADALSQVVKSHSRKCDESFGKSDYPIGESTLERIWRSQTQAGIDGKTACKTFQRQAESVARPETQGDIFPKRVVHEGFCGEQCRHHSSSDRISMHCNTMALFNYIVEQSLDRWVGGICLAVNAVTSSDMI
eukprot:s191_g21.t1